MKTKVILVDDERLARKELNSLLAAHPNLEVIAECSDANDAKEKIETLRPDLVFLDIQMPEKTGFDLLEELDYFPQIIFVTAYNEYAIKAFEVNAFDYILKPIDPGRLAASIQKLPQKTTENNTNSKLQLEDKIFLKDGEKCWFVKLSDIRYFESEGNYVKVYFNDNKPLILKSLNNIEERMDERLFFRTSRKHIINLNWIKQVDNWFSNGLKITLTSGEEIDVSRRQAQRFRDRMSL